MSKTRKAKASRYQDTADMNAIATHPETSSIPILGDVEDPSERLGDGIEAEWIKTGIGDQSWFIVSFTPDEKWLDVTAQTDFCYQFAVDNPRKYWWLVPVTINVNPGRYPSLPGEVMLRATCAEVVMVGRRVVARFELEWRG